MLENKKEKEIKLNVHFVPIRGICVLCSKVMFWEEIRQEPGVPSVFLLMTVKYEHHILCCHPADLTCEEQVL